MKSLDYRYKTKSECWIWNGKPTMFGYGQIQIGSKSFKAHRFVYEKLVGKVPEGLFLDHLCRNRLCVNPQHLEPTTKKINILRGVSVVAVNAKKTHCPKGHELSDKNLVKRKDGWRECLTCRNTKR